MKIVEDRKEGIPDIDLAREQLVRAVSKYLQAKDHSARIDHPSVVTGSLSEKREAYIEANLAPDEAFEQIMEAVKRLRMSGVRGDALWDEVKYAGGVHGGNSSYLSQLVATRIELQGDAEVPNITGHVKRKREEKVIAYARNQTRLLNQALR